MPGDMSDKVRPEVEEVMTGIARLIKGAMPDNMGFVLMVFDFGPQGFCSYMSSAEREDTIRMMRDLCDQLERRRADGTS